MTRLFWRIYGAVLVVLLVFGTLAYGVAQYHAQRERDETQAAWTDWSGGWGDPLLTPLLYDEDGERSRGLWMVGSLAIAWGLVGLVAYPVVRSLTRRLERLRAGVQAFGQGDLRQRVDVSGRDEVAALAASFNAAAARIETLVQAHRSLLANASHELRSPLARLRLALSLLRQDPAAADARWREIERNLAELDALVEEVLLASRLQAMPAFERAPVELLGLAAEEAAAVGAEVEGVMLTVLGDERLLRRAVRNLLDNARRHAPPQPPDVQLRRVGDAAELRVCDRGPGVPEAERERIFEPFYRLRGHGESAGGVGLGLSLVRQIAERHGGSVHCEPRPGGGSCFVLRLPLR